MTRSHIGVSLPPRLSESNEKMSQVRAKRKGKCVGVMPHSDPLAGLQVSLEIKVRFFNLGRWLYGVCLVAPCLPAVCDLWPC